MAATGKRARTAAQEEAEANKSVVLLRSTNQTRVCFTKIRDENTGMEDFLFFADRIIRLLVEEALNNLPVEEAPTKTPTGATYSGAHFTGHICGVSIVRAGESMEKALREVCKKVRIGKILIQRDEATALPKLFYTKLPDDIAERHVLLLDPMLATGGSAIQATHELIKVGVKPEKIVFINLVAAPEGIKAYTDTFPAVKIVVGEIDECLDDKKYIIPGLGDFGDRYFGTNI